MLLNYRMHIMVLVALVLLVLNVTSPLSGRDQKNDLQLVLPAHQPGNTPSLPSSESRPLLEVATRNPFAVSAMPAAVVPTPKIEPPPPIAVPLQPAIPPHNLVYVGRVTTPDGAEKVFVMLDGSSFPIVVGQMLPNNYRVEAIHSKYVELSYPGSEVSARLDLPAAPKYEVR